MSVTPSFSGEIQLAGWSESHNGGCKVTFWLADPADLEAFRQMTVRKGNTAGQRMMAALVEIGDDEQPVPPSPPLPKPPKPRDKMSSYCYQAVVWCQSPEFRQWILDHTGGKPPFTEADARAFVVARCEIDSRKDIDLSSGAQKLWHERIAGPYRKWRIARGLE